MYFLIPNPQSLLPVDQRADALALYGVFYVAVLAEIEHHNWQLVTGALRNRLMIHHAEIFQDRR